MLHEEFLNFLVNLNLTKWQKWLQPCKVAPQDLA